MAKSNNDYLPITDGYFADPSIVKRGDTYYIYVTIDPWSGEELAVLETKNFKHFERRRLNWPTKTHYARATARAAMDWAPFVRRAADGKYYRRGLTRTSIPLPAIGFRERG